MLQRIGILGVVVLFQFSSAFSATAIADDRAHDERPNIVVILADDMNYGCNCSGEIARENHCFSPSSEMN